jgi:ureidoacrylate peracid hydrolase
MHKIDIPADVRARSRRARGRDHVLETIDLARTAHVIVDLQNGFMAEGALVEVPVAREIVPNVNAIVAAVRQAGGLNVFLRYTYDASEPLTWTGQVRHLPRQGLQRRPQERHQARRRAVGAVA